MRGNLSKHDYRRVPLRIAEAWAKGYLTVSKLNHELVHFTPPEPYASTLCGKSTDLYGRTLIGDDCGMANARFCKECVDAAEKKRILGNKEIA